MPSLPSLLLLLLCVSATCSAWSPRPSSDIIDSFARDGYNVSKQVTFNGFRGFKAQNVVANNLFNGQPKQAVYVEGPPFTMGYLLGQLSSEDIDTMSTSFLDAFLPSLLLPDLEEKYRNSSLWTDITEILAEFLVSGTNKAFNEMYAAGNTFPEALVDEMRGVAAGAQDANPGGPTTFERVVTLNMGFDFVSVWAFSGQLIHALREVALARRNPPPDPLLLELLDPTKRKPFELIRPPGFCDAFGVKNSATVDGRTIFARDFQLVTGDILQNLFGLFLFNPSDGRFASVGVTAPGMVGYITGLNQNGVAMGVDTLRSSFGNTSWFGLNSDLLIRHVMDSSINTQDAIKIVGTSMRGTPYLYPMCDSSGDCVVIESGSYVDDVSGNAFNPLMFAGAAVLPLLPNASYIQQHSSSSLWNYGCYVRDFKWVYPFDYISDFNPTLFQNSLKLPYNATAFSSAVGLIFDDWRTERAEKINNNYFPPLRKVGSDDVIIVSNLAIVPEMRITMMSDLDDLLAGLTDESPQWRYDSLNILIRQAYGNIDIAKTKNIITFLSPDRTPGYWNKTIWPNDPMSAQIEGAIAVVDLQVVEREAEAAQQLFVIHAKTGYWRDEWYNMTLLNYI